MFMVTVIFFHLNEKKNICAVFPLVLQLTRNV